MANIDIAERLFAYAREKQQKDLANNLIKKEDIIDFSSADFNSFNQEISNMLGGMDNEQVNMFVHILQNKMDHNITDVITPGEKGFTLNISAISSTIKQVKEQAEFANNFSSKEEQNSETVGSKQPIDEKTFFEKIRSDNEKALENYSKYGELSDAFKDIFLLDPENKYKKFMSLTKEEKEQVHEDYKNITKEEVFGDLNLDIDVTQAIAQFLQIPQELLDKMAENGDYQYMFDIFINDLALNIVHGNLINADGSLNQEAAELFFRKYKIGLEYCPFLQDVLDEVQNSPALSSLPEKINQEQARAKIVTLNYSKYSEAYYEDGYDRIHYIDDFELKIGSLLRQKINYVGELPDCIKDKIFDFVSTYIFLDDESGFYYIDDDIDYEEIKQLFTIDPKEHPELIDTLGSRGIESKLDSAIDIKKDGEYYVNNLPGIMAMIVSNAKEATDEIYYLRYSEDDMKQLRPLLEKFSATELALTDKDLCRIINESTQIETPYTHVNVENIIRNMKFKTEEYGLDFTPDMSNYEENSLELTRGLNNISKKRTESLVERTSFADFDDLKKYDINRFSPEDLKYNDVQEFLGERAEKMRLAKSYKKLFPSQTALKLGFKYDFDVKILKMTDLDMDSQLEIYTDPIKNSRFLTFATALSMLYKNGDQNISSTIDRKQQERNLEILKANFLKDFKQETLEKITVDTMSDVVESLITNKEPNSNERLQTATALSTHINLNHVDDYSNFISGDSLVAMDLDHPGFLLPKTYKTFSKNPVEEKTVNNAPVKKVHQEFENKDVDIYPTVQKRPRGLLGFISSFAKQFKETKFEDGIFNRIKKSFDYAKNSISDTSEYEDNSSTEIEEFKPSQSSSTNDHRQLDSFSQSLSVRNSDGSYNPEVKTESSEGDSKKHDETEIDI